MKKKTGLKINNRVLEEIKNKGNDQDIIRKQEADKLTKRLKELLESEIINKIEVSRILLEIRDKKYYVLYNFKNFTDFLKDYELAKSQIYRYFAIVQALKDNKIEFSFFKENGLEKTIEFLENKHIIKKSKQNPLKPLRFQLVEQEIFDFYKKNIKFASFLLTKIYKENKEYLNSLFEEFKNK